MKKRILVVDDEMDFTFVMKLTLEGTGLYQVRTLNMAAQFATVARDFKPDMILLDCMMPGLDGGQAAGMIQADPQLRETPFAFLTATVSEPEVATSRCYQGAQTYLPKTMPLEDLMAYVEQRIGGEKESAKA